MVNTVRRFIRHYMFTSYNISTRQLNTGLSVNITLSYHPNTSITNVKSCDRALVHAITTHNKKLRSVLQNTLYTTFRKTKNIGSYLLNYRNAVKTFDPKSPPPCSHPHLCKKTKHRKHFLFMPYEMPLQEQSMMRNMDTPVMASPRDHIQDIADTMIELQ